MCPRKIIGLISVALSVGFLLAVLLPPWCILWIFVVILLLYGILQLR